MQLDDDRPQSPADDLTSNVDSRDDDYQHDQELQHAEISELDEYLNAEQMAEEQYNDVNRKYKCHKCKMAFTQSYFLTAHYKSQTHRRHDKLNNYPLEKYLDPNRPFKCEICRESFTQKNILLVHYNSVSHLHKLKKQQNESGSGSTTPAPMGSSLVSPSTSPNQDDRRSVEFDRKSIDYDMEIASIGESHKRKLSSSDRDDYDSPKKRFKCDICKVAYAQGSTLDIHMRSVLHQTRACRLQEQKMQQQQAQQAQAQPQDFQLFAQQNNGNISVSPKLAAATNPVYKTLLENFGFDIVKQFNEINKLGQQPADASNGAHFNLNLSALEAGLQQQIAQLHQGLTPSIEADCLQKALTQKTADEPDSYYCRHCKKAFSSIFVLKSHCEEQHNEKIPADLLDKFAEKFKTYLEKDQDEILDFSSKAPGKEAVAPPQAQPPQQIQPPEMFLQQQNELKLDPALLAQRMMEQQLLAQFPQLTQSLQNAGAANLPMNTVEMMNLIQLHHLMSLNFMNLAPPLIIGGNSAATSVVPPAQANTASVLGAQKTVSDVISPLAASTPSNIIQQSNSGQLSASGQVKPFEI